MSVLVFAGRVLFAAIFLYAAMGHLFKTATMAEYARRRGVPLPRLTTISGGIILMAGGLSILLGVWIDLGALLLTCFLVPTAVVMHRFWSETGETRVAEQTQFLKDIALAGAALMIAGLAAEAGELEFALTRPYWR